MKHELSQVPQLGRMAAEQGIFAPEPELLAEGSYIYRFASDTAGLGYQAGSWWIRERDFDFILDRASRQGVDLGQQARRSLVVLQKWGNKMNVVTKARVSSRLWAWTGLAKPQQETTPNGKVIRLFGTPSIRQLFLYGVTDGVSDMGKGKIDGSGMLTSRGREALAVVGEQVIDSKPFY